MIFSLMDWKVPLQRETPRTDLLRIWNSIFYILIYDVRFKELPGTPAFAHRAKAHRGLIYWQKSGVFDRVLSCLLKKAAQAGRINLATRLVDGSFSPQPQGRPRC